MAVTLKEIARLAGVSRPAVSLVMRDPETKHVAEEKRREILRLAKELDYRPDYAAMKLRGKPTRSVGILGSLFSVPIHAAITDGVMKRLWERGYQVLLGDHYCSADKERQIAAELETRGVDGLILTNTVDASLLDALRSPFVAVTHNQSYFDLAVDLRLGGLLAGRHLLEHGHRRLGFVAGGRQSGLLRREGLAAALDAANLDFKPNWTVHHEDSGANFGGTLAELVKKEGVTGFFCLNDFFAAKVIRELGKRGVGTPRDAAVIGFDGLAFGALTTPSLCSVAQPVARLAAAAVDLMIARIEAPWDRRPAPELLSPTLCLGESCGCHPAEAEWQASRQLTLPETDLGVIRK